MHDSGGRYFLGQFVKLGIVEEDQFALLESILRSRGCQFFH